MLLVSSHPVAPARPKAHYNEAVEARCDYNRDGYEDLLVVRRSDGALRFYAGNSIGAYKAGVTTGTRGKTGQIAVGQYDGDGDPDILATSFPDGILFLYPGNGKGGHGSRVTIRRGWNAMNIA